VDTVTTIFIENNPSPTQNFESLLPFSDAPPPNSIVVNQLQVPEVIPAPVTTSGGTDKISPDDQLTLQVSGVMQVPVVNFTDTAGNGNGGGTQVHVMVQAPVADTEGENAVNTEIIQRQVPVMVQAPVTLRSGKSLAEGHQNKLSNDSLSRASVTTLW
jgi:hypothetical protein